MRVSDLLRAGGDLQDAAYVEKAELVRFLVDGGQRKAELLEIDLAAVLRGDSSADVALNPFDTVLIKEIPEWSQRESITLRGEVRFPGSYPIRRGETLRSVLERAGGLTGLAFTKGAVFSRLELAERERKQIQDLSNRLRADLASRAVQAGNLAAAGGRQAEGDGNFAVLQGLLQDLNNSKPVGRLVIDLDSVIAGPIGSARDVVLRDGDELVIPKLRQEVSVIGEVQNSTSHLYRSGLTRADYLGLSGGVTRRADTARLYVVRADGSVATSGRSWFGGGDTLAIQPGDTIVVPVDTERVPRLGLWQAVSTIIYNSAVALAAIRSL
jgi:protein involved in polysaccharide export with SLBB domain